MLPPDEGAAVCEAVVVGPVLTLGTVGDFEPLAQAATVKTKPMTTAGHSLVVPVTNLDG